MVGYRGSRSGSAPGEGLLHGLHGAECTNGTEYSAARAVSSNEDNFGFTVVYMAWCGECGACAWEAVY